MTDDSDSCLKSTTNGAWNGFTCSDTKEYCTDLSWEKDTSRCCPTTCKNSFPFDNVKQGWSEDIFAQYFRNFHFTNGY